MKMFSLVSFIYSIFFIFCLITIEYFKFLPFKITKWEFGAYFLLAFLVGVLYFVVFRFTWKGASFLFPLIWTTTTVLIVNNFTKQHENWKEWVPFSIILFIFFHAVHFTVEYYRNERLTCDKMMEVEGNEG